MINGGFKLKIYFKVNFIFINKKVYFILNYVINSELSPFSLISIDTKYHTKIQQTYYRF